MSAKSYDQRSTLKAQIKYDSVDFHKRVVSWSVQECPETDPPSTLTYELCLGDIMPASTGMQSSALDAEVGISNSYTGAYVDEDRGADADDSTSEDTEGDASNKSNGKQRRVYLIEGSQENDDYPQSGSSSSDSASSGSSGGGNSRGNEFDKAARYTSQHALASERKSLAPKIKKLSKHLEGGLTSANENLNQLIYNICPLPDSNQNSSEAKYRSSTRSPNVAVERQRTPLYHPHDEAAKSAKNIPGPFHQAKEKSVAAKSTTSRLVQDNCTLASGLQKFTIAKNSDVEGGYDVYLGTAGAHKELDHVSACRFTAANIVVTAYDNIKEGSNADDTNVFTSLRQPLPNADDETVALYRRVLNSMYQCTGPTLDAGSALCKPEVFSWLSEQTLPAIKRIVTVHLYDIPKDAYISPVERELLFLSRREQLHEMLLQLTQCSTLVLAFENHNVLENSGIDDFFRKHPKRTSLKLEMRIGPIWSRPLETPKMRIAKDGISSIWLAEECVALLPKIKDDSCACNMHGHQGWEIMRSRMLLKMNEVLGAGLVVPYGSRVDSMWLTTRLWTKEVWIWGSLEKTVI